jgi:hypothetical protein
MQMCPVCSVQQTTGAWTLSAVYLLLKELRPRLTSAVYAYAACES